MNSQEIFRVEDKEDPSSFYVQRIKNGQVQILKETTCDSGEIQDPENENLTIQTITITRHLGEKILF